jgi:L-lactate dehydrogenase (cytochrome)
MHQGQKPADLPVAHLTKFELSPLRTLPEIAAEPKGMTVILDGGVRPGTDVLKALALGAQFVFVGRPFLFAAVDTRTI